MKNNPIRYFKSRSKNVSCLLDLSNLTLTEKHAEVHVFENFKMERVVFDIIYLHKLSNGT